MVITRSPSVIVARRSRSATATTEKKLRKEDKNHPNKPIGLPGTPNQKGAGEPAPVHKKSIIKIETIIVIGEKVGSLRLEIVTTIGITF